MEYKTYKKICPNCKETLESTHRGDMRVCGCSVWYRHPNPSGVGYSGTWLRARDEPTDNTENTDGLPDPGC